MNKGNDLERRLQIKRLRVIKAGVVERGRKGT